jgi:asparagine synthase (glutamine-hydrolysing)
LYWLNGNLQPQRITQQFEGKYQFQTESDCEVILALYQEGPHFVDENGIFGFAIYDVKKKDEYFIARDP